MHGVNKATPSTTNKTMINAYNLSTFVCFCFVLFCFVFFRNALVTRKTTDKHFVIKNYQI